MKIDQDDNLWFINLFNQICRYSPDHKLDIVDFNEDMSMLSFWIKGDEVGVFRNPKYGSILNRNTLRKSEFRKHNFKIPCLNEDLYIIQDSLEAYIIKDDKRKIINDTIHSAIRTFFRFGEHLYGYSMFRNSIFRFKEMEDYYKVEDIKLQDPFFANSISEISDSTLLVNTRKGIYTYNADFKHLESSEFPNVNVTESLIDSENNLWLSCFAPN